MAAYAPVPQQPTVAYHDQLEGKPLDWVEPRDNSATRSAGITVVLASLGLGGGLLLGGPWGAGAGLMLAGSLANGYRAQKWWSSIEPSEKHEAIVSATFAAFEVVLGSYFAYKAHQTRKGAAA